MRLLSVILASLAAVIAVTVWLQREATMSAGPSPFPPKLLHVVGPGNTLASIARQADNPLVFSYDPQTRTAVTRATLIIEGELQLGKPGDPASGECLEMATQVCGDLRIEVRPGGVLRLDHSTLRTVSQVLSNTACSRGYALFVDGSLLMDHARISYISGSTSQCLRQSAQAVIRDSSFAYCDGSALSCVNVDGGRIIIERSELLCSGNYALIVQGSGGEPLVVRDTVFDSQLGDVLLTGESARVVLIDCVFDPAKIVFNRESGELTVQWTRRFKVIEAGGRRAVADAVVRATPRNGSGDGMAVEARTDGAGVASLTLTDRVILPGAQGRNTSPQVRYDVTVVGPGGRGTARLEDLAVRGKEIKGSEPITLELKPYPEASKGDRPEPGPTEVSR